MERIRKKYEGRSTKFGKQMGKFTMINDEFTSPRPSPSGEGEVWP
jgi:hypothetical protein